MNTRLPRCLNLVLVTLLASGTCARAEAAKIKLVRTPDSGLQPQAVVDRRGVTHLIYFKGKPGGGDIFYVRQAPDREGFSEPLPVNHQPGDAIAVGTIRGAQLALGAGGRVHVAWNGNKSGESAKHPGVPMWYTRLNDAGTAFEPERDLMTFTGGLDGGGTVAADDQGNVYVLWHGFGPDAKANEAGRAVYVASSSDGGKSFAPERKVSAAGACGCCGMRAFADRSGNVFALYRAANEVVNRDEVLLVSRDRGANFEKAYAHPWNTASCPMSSAWLTGGGGGASGALAAWETAGQVYFASVDPKTLVVSKPSAAPGVGKRKHPVAAVNASGEVLLAWAEGTGWQKGGALAWQLFDANGRATDDRGRTDGIPVWGLVAAVPKPDGAFVIYY